MKKVCSSYVDCTEKRTVLFEKNGYPILECNKCKHRFLEIEDPETHLSETYSDDYFFEGKDGYPNYLEEKDLLVKQGLRYAKIISKYTSPGKVLDVGCAAGFILKGFEQSGWSCRGVEPNDTMAEYGRTNLHLDIKTGGLETFESNEKFDLINLVQVIGHFYDLDKALKNVDRLIKQNGLVLIESWNMKSIAAQVMGKRWHEYSPPSVVHWFSDKTLTQLFNYYGFEIIAKGHPVKKISAKHAISFIEGKIPKNKFLDLSGKLIGNLTLNYPLRDVKWYIFKKL